MDIELIRAVAYGREGELPANMQPVTDKAWRWGTGRGARNGLPLASHVERPRSITTWEDPSGARVSRIVRADGTVFTCASEAGGREPMYEGEYVPWDGDGDLVAALLAMPGW